MNNEKFIDILKGIDDYYIKKVKLGKETIIEIEGEVFADTITIVNGEFPYNIYIKNCIFKKGISILGGTFNGLNIDKKTDIFDSKIGEAFEIRGGTFNGYFNFQGVVKGNFSILPPYPIGINGILQKDFDIPKFKKELAIYGKIGLFRIFSGEFNSIQIQNKASFDRGIIITNHRITGPLNEIKKLYGNIKSLYIDVSKKNINIQYQLIEKLILSGTTENAQIDISDVYTNEVKFLHINNTSENVKIARIIPYTNKASINFFESFLGKMIFFDIDFTKFTINVCNSQFSNIKTYGINRFENVVVYEKNASMINNYLPIEEKGNKRKVKKKISEMFGELKYSAIEQKRKKDELFFKGKELLFLERSLSLKNIFDRLVLFIGRISNNHGDNRIKPILLLLGINSFFFMGISYYSLMTNDVCSLNNYLNLLNPAHKEILTAAKGLGFLIEFLSRVINGVLIYQILSAFRKYQ